MAASSYAALKGQRWPKKRLGGIEINVEVNVDGLIDTTGVGISHLALAKRGKERSVKRSM